MKTDQSKSTVSLIQKDTAYKLIGGLWVFLNLIQAAYSIPHNVELAPTLPSIYTQINKDQTQTNWKFFYKSAMKKDCTNFTDNKGMHLLCKNFLSWGDSPNSQHLFDQFFLLEKEEQCEKKDEALCTIIRNIFGLTEDKINQFIRQKKSKEGVDYLDFFEIGKILTLPPKSALELAHQIIPTDLDTPSLFQELDSFRPFINSAEENIVYRQDLLKDGYEDYLFDKISNSEFLALLKDAIKAMKHYTFITDTIMLRINIYNKNRTLNQTPQNYAEIFQRRKTFSQDKQYIQHLTREYNDRLSKIYETYKAYIYI